MRSLIVVAGSDCRLTIGGQPGDIGRMRLIDEQSAAEYLRETRRIGRDEPVRVTELTGGVSNMVLRVERPAATDFVLKQARRQLRTAQPWFSSETRAWREAQVLAICGELLERAAARSDAQTNGAATTPRLLFEDRDNYVFAITAAPQPHRVWKSELLAGRADESIARACGRLLGTLHGESWLDSRIATAVGDFTLFHELRVDPYYRTLAVTQPEAREWVQSLIASLGDHPRSLVHADFSPKNLLVSDAGLMMVDFETGHYGDPAFDLGFFLSHLVLKACYLQPRQAEYLRLADVFWESYCQKMAERIPPVELADLSQRAMQNLAGCAWARLDGKSPVEYLTDTGQREQIRAACREIFRAQPGGWPAAREFFVQAFR